MLIKSKDRKKKSKDQKDLLNEIIDFNRKLTK